MFRKRRVIFLQDLQVHADREACHGAAEYAAGRPDWSFDPWPICEIFSKYPSAEDLRLADAIVSNERVYRQIFGAKQIKTPHVFFLTDAIQHGAPSASLDEHLIGQMAAEHLLSRGYQNLAFIGSAECRWSTSRREGFAATVQKRMREPRIYEFPLETLPVFWTWDVIRRSENLFQLLESLPTPCGVFAANDVIACFVLQAARDKGYRVPEDIGVVGVDDDPLPNAAAGLAISSVHPDFRSVGRQAAQLLDEIWHNKPVPERILIPPVRVVVRASTDAFMTDDPLVNRAQQYIEEHRHQPVLVNEVIRALGTNRVTLGKKFRQHLNIGLQKYILNRRIEYASEQLREGKMSVERIAEVCGFSSSSYFSRVFRKVVRTSPGALRRKKSF